MWVGEVVEEVEGGGEGGEEVEECVGKEDDVCWVADYGLGPFGVGVEEARREGVVVGESQDVKRVGEKWALFGSDRLRTRSKAALSVSASSWSSSSLASVGGCASRRRLSRTILSGWVRKGLGVGSIFSCELRIKLTLTEGSYCGACGSRRSRSPLSVFTLRRRYARIRLSTARRLLRTCLPFSFLSVQPRICKGLWVQTYDLVGVGKRDTRTEVVSLYPSGDAVDASQSPVFFFFAMYITCTHLPFAFPADKARLFWKFW